LKPCHIGGVFLYLFEHEFFRFTPLILISQVTFLDARCNDSKTITYTDVSVGTYVGCLDDYENFEGDGDYLIKDSIFKVNLENNFSLLGMDFMDMFSNVIWNKRDSSLTLYK
jgi:hypothetical protein